MITVNAKINLLDGSNSSLNVSSITNSKNNISSEISAIIGSKNQNNGRNPFLLGKSKLGEGNTFEKKVNYYIGSAFSNEQGIFESPYEIVINGNAIKHINIVFDKYNNKHPNYIIIDGNTYYDDDSSFNISNLQEADTHTITIYNWNAPNSPLVIQAIYIELVIEIDNTNLISLNAPNLDRGNISLPSWGIISNSGKMSFNDKSREILDYTEQNMLVKNLALTINLKNSINGKTEKIGEYITNVWDYDNDNREVNLSFKDDLEEWQNILIDGITYDVRYIQDLTLEYFYRYLYSLTPEKYNMLDFEELDSETQTILSNTYTKYGVLDASTLWVAWEKLCRASQSYIYKKNGKTIFKYSNGY